MLVLHYRGYEKMACEAYDHMVGAGERQEAAPADLGAASLACCAVVSKVFPARRT
jgi:hypothetical protein